MRSLARTHRVLMLSEYLIRRRQDKQAGECTRALHVYGRFKTIWKSAAFAFRIQTRQQTFFAHKHTQGMRFASGSGGGGGNAAHGRVSRKLKFKTGCYTARAIKQQEGPWTTLCLSPRLITTLVQTNRARKSTLNRSLMRHGESQNEQSDNALKSKITVGRAASKFNRLMSAARN